MNNDNDNDNDCLKTIGNELISNISGSGIGDSVDSNNNTENNNIIKNSGDALSEITPLVEKKFLPIPAFTNTVKTFAGAGTFGLPGAMVNAGLWIGSIGFVLMAVLSNYTMNLLLKCLIKFEDEKSNRTKPSYADLAFRAFGRYGELTVCFIIFIVTMCICVSYLILIGQNFGLITNIDYAPMIWIVLPFIMVLTCLTDMRYLGPSSIFGVFSLMLAMGTILAFGIRDNYVHHPSEYTFDYRNIPLWFGNAAFFFCDHIVIVPVSHSSGDNKKFPRVLNYAMAFITIVNIAFAVLCYLYYNFSVTGVPASIIDVLPDGVFANIVRICVVLELSCSFPLVFESGISVVDSSISFFHNHFNAFPKKNLKLSNSNNSSNNNTTDKQPIFSRNWKFYTIRILFCSILAGLASTITSFGLFTSLIGSLMLATAGFIIPPLLSLKFFPNQSKPLKAWHIIITIFGIFSTGLGTYLSIKGFIDA